MNHDIPLPPNRFEPLILGRQRALAGIGWRFEVDQLIRIREYDAATAIFSGRWADVRVVHVAAVEGFPLTLVSVDVLRTGCDPSYMLDNGGRRCSLEQRRAVRGSIAA